MIETDDTGQNILEELIKNLDDPVFNEWEYMFLKDMRGKKYRDLSKHQKAVVTRLWGWFMGK